MKMTVGEIVKALNLKNGNQDSETVVTSVTFDSRKAQQDSLFVPLTSEDRDGHDFIENAVENGATATFWNKDKKIPENVDVEYIVVDDTLQAMQDLSKYYLNKINPKVVAVTGSNGKTTTKDLIASVLGQENNVTYTYANFNNEIGVPVTVLNMNANTEVLVVEMGMDRPGQLTKLSSLVDPDVAVITMIGEAHIEFFGTRDKIADAKMEIVTSLKEDGYFVYNGDEPLLNERAKNVDQDKVTFGQGDSNAIYPIKQEFEKDQTIFRVNIWPEDDIVLPLMGDYNVNNALAAIAVGNLFHINKQNIIKGIKEFVPTKNRSQWMKGKNGADILSDVYNSNPTAVKDVLDNLRHVKSSGRKILVLGDMLELGDKSKELHESLADSINQDDFDEVYLVGPNMKYLAEKLETKYDDKKAIKHYDLNELDKLSEDLEKDIKPNDTVLLKASNGVHLDKVLENIV